MVAQSQSIFFKVFINLGGKIVMLPQRNPANTTLANGHQQTHLIYVFCTWDNALTRTHLPVVFLPKCWTSIWWWENCQENSNWGIFWSYKTSSKLSSSWNVRTGWGAVTDQKRPSWPDSQWNVPSRNRKGTLVEEPENWIKSVVN